MIQEEEDDLAAEEENKIINEVSALSCFGWGTWRSLWTMCVGVQDLVSREYGMWVGIVELNVPLHIAGRKTRRTSTM